MATRRGALRQYSVAVRMMLAATVIPIADSAIVLTHGGPRSIAFGVHGLTAVVMLVTAALLLVS